LNIKKTKIVIFAILVAFFMLTFISTNFAATSVGGMKDIDYNENYVKLNANKQVYSIEKSKIPKKLKSYEDKTFQVAKGKKIKYKASVNAAGNLFYNLKGIKVKKASVNFGDGNKKTTTGWIAHTYKKSGWYKIKVTIIEATFTNCSSDMIYSQDMSGSITNTTKEYLVYVANKPQLSLSMISAGYYTKKNYQKGNIDYLVIKVANLGSKASKATKISMWYQKPGNKNIGKVYSKLKKYTASAKLKALKPGKTAKIILKFKIPKKYSKLVKNLRLGTSSLNQISKSNAFYTIN